MPTAAALCLLQFASPFTPIIFDFRRSKISGKRDHRDEKTIAQRQGTTCCSANDIEHKSRFFMTGQSSLQTPAKQCNATRFKTIRGDDGMIFGALT